jgi:hypothetical protein
MYHRMVRKTRGDSCGIRSRNSVAYNARVEGKPALAATCIFDLLNLQARCQCVRSSRFLPILVM